MEVASAQVDALVRVREMAASGEARRIRECARLSLSDIADEVGTDPSQIAAWERGEHMPRRTRALAWLELLDRLQVLVGGQEPAA